MPECRVCGKFSQTELGRRQHEGRVHGYYPPPPPDPQKEALYRELEELSFKNVCEFFRQELIAKHNGNGADLSSNAVRTLLAHNVLCRVSKRERGKPLFVLSPRTLEVLGLAG